MRKKTGTIELPAAASRSRVQSVHTVAMLRVFSCFSSPSPLLSHISSFSSHQVFSRFDTNFPENEVQALVESMDLDGSGNISWKEFQRVVGLGVR